MQQPLKQQPLLIPDSETKTYEDILMKPTEKLEMCYNSFRRQTDFVPKVALVLGSGLGGFAERVSVEQVINYDSIEGFPCSTVSGHAGRLVLGCVGEVPVAVMQGRVHYYEGNDMSDVVLPLRVLRLAGADKLILTNAAGGINRGFARGDLMLIRDHIASLVPSPLRGENIDRLGVRFPDMTHVYDEELCDTALKAASELGITLREGVYIQVPGPQYETPTEIKMYRSWGADAVGMSTACEAVAAVHAGYRVLGISLISNAAAGITGQPLTHEEVKEAADRAEKGFCNLVQSLVADMGDKR